MNKFVLNEVEEQRAEQFKEAVKEVYGEYGKFQYIFSPGSGIGYGVEIHSEKANTTKDITDYESW